MIGGIFAGMFTPTEAGAVGVRIASIGVLYRFYWHHVLGFLKWMGVPIRSSSKVDRLLGEPEDVEPTARRAVSQALADATRVAGMILAILIGAALFSQFVSL